MAAKPNQKWLNYYLSILAINDGSKPSYTSHSLKYLITMVTNVKAYVRTAIFVYLHSITDNPKDKVVSANQKGLSLSDQK